MLRRKARRERSIHSGALPAVGARAREHRLAVVPLDFGIVSGQRQRSLQVNVGRGAVLQHAPQGRVRATVLGVGLHRETEPELRFAAPILTQGQREVAQQVAPLRLRQRQLLDLPGDREARQRERRDTAASPSPGTP